MAISSKDIAIQVLQRQAELLQSLWAKDIYPRDLHESLEGHMTQGNYVEIAAIALILATVEEGK